MIRVNLSISRSKYFDNQKDLAEYLGIKNTSKKAIVSNLLSAEEQRVVKIKHTITNYDTTHVSHKYNLLVKLDDNGDTINNYVPTIEELKELLESLTLKIRADTNICPTFTKNLKLKPMQDLLELYKKDTFSDEDNRLINLAIDNQELYTDEIKDDFMDFMYPNIPCKYENEEIWGYIDENYENGLTHKQNFNNLLNYLNN